MPITSAWSDPNSLDLIVNDVLNQTTWENVCGNLLWLFGTTGASQSFTPTLTQSGSVSTSSATGRYIKVGKWVVAQCSVTASSAGTAGNQIIIGGLPVAQSNDAFPHCVGRYLNAAGNSNYLLVGEFATTTSMILYSGGAATGRFGVNPVVTIASGDIISLILIYEGP